MSKPSLPKGVRDFGVSVMAKREFIFATIKSVYQKYGFSPIETPAIENLNVLTGKYGDEGDQLIFKILNSGDFLSDIRTQNTNVLNEDLKKILPLISEKALRYDLTVPFARFVAMNRNDIIFPFKRYQIQPVWRADRPQKGRYREFYQCDADVVGTDSLICEAEIVLMVQEVLENLGINDVLIKINNRKILTGIAEVIGAEGKEATICVAIDKLDKIGEEAVIKELLERGISQNSVDRLLPILKIDGSNEGKLAALEIALASSEIGKQGIDELKKVFSYTLAFSSEVSQLQIDISLARGLSYYTGAIFEVKAMGVQIGSISGGGRYDNLTGLFGLDGVSGVGISFGVDRVFDVMTELNLFPASTENATKVMVTNFDSTSELVSLGVLAALRKANIASEIYLKSEKLKKQFGYADSKKIPYVLVIGEEEIKTGEFALKNMQSGEQKKLNLQQLIEALHEV
ncbi:MAG: histidine--tRNA ligase [Cytophagales bacterium]